VEERTPYLVAIPHPEAVRRPRWVELYRNRRLWGKYCPETEQIQFARGDRLETFELGPLRRAWQEQKKE